MQVLADGGKDTVMFIGEEVVDVLCLFYFFRCGIRKENIARVVVDVKIWSIFDAVFLPGWRPPGN